MNISLPLWVGSLNVSPYCIAVLSLAALSLSLFCFSFFFLSLSLALFLAVLFSACIFGHTILFVSHLCPYLSPLFSPICILYSLTIAILLISSLRLLSVLVSQLLCSSLCALGRNLLSVTFPHPRSLLPLVFPLPFLSLLVHLFFPSAFFTLITVVISGCFWDPRFSLPPMCSNLCPYSANFSPFSYSILLSYSFYSPRCCFCLGFRTFRCFGAINITESIIRVTSILGRRGEFFSSFLSFLTCSSSFSQCFFRFSPH